MIKLFSEFVNEDLSYTPSTNSISMRREGENMMRLGVTIKYANDRFSHVMPCITAVSKWFEANYGWENCLVVPIDGKVDSGNLQINAHIDAIALHYEDNNVVKVLPFDFKFSDEAQHAYNVFFHPNEYEENLIAQDITNNKCPAAFVTAGIYDAIYKYYKNENNRKHIADFVLQNIIKTNRQDVKIKVLDHAILNASFGRNSEEILKNAVLYDSNKIRDFIYDKDILKLSYDTLQKELAKCENKIYSNSSDPRKISAKRFVVKGVDTPFTLVYAFDNVNNLRLPNIILCFSRWNNDVIKRTEL